jgi:uncharacterized protein
MRTNPLFRTGLASILVVTASLAWASGPVDSSITSPLSGRWDGSLSTEGRELVITLDFVEGGALLDVPAQMLFGLPITGISFAPENKVRIELPNTVPLVIDATWTADGITGNFTQALTTGTVSFKPVAPDANDGAPYAVDTGRGKLQGSLLLPADMTKPVPVVLFIAGSGPTDRDGNNFSVPGKSDSMKLLARALADRGIASLRYDKRGSGESFSLVKSEADLVFDDYIADASVLARTLKADKRFSSLTILGHSEGALVGACAALDSGADRFVSLAGAGFPIYDVLKRQLESQSADQDETKREAILKESDAIIDSLKAGKTVDTVSDDLQELFRPSVQPYFISWFKHDPKADLAKLAIPVLIVQGDADLQISIEDAEALKQGKPDAGYAVIKGMNHVLKTASADDVEGNYKTYSDPALPLADGLADAIAQFIGK